MNPSILKIQEIKYVIEYTLHQELNRYVVNRWESVTTGIFLGAAANK